MYNVVVQFECKMPNFQLSVLISLWFRVSGFRMRCLNLDGEFDIDGVFPAIDGAGRWPNVRGGSRAEVGRGVRRAGKPRRPKNVTLAKLSCDYCIMSEDLTQFRSWCSECL